MSQPPDEPTDLKREIRKAQRDAEASRQEALSLRSQLEAAHRRAEEADQWFRDAVVAHDAEIRTLLDLLNDAQSRLEVERSKRDQVEIDLDRLRQRRSVRLALKLAGLARPIFRTLRGHQPRPAPGQPAPEETSEFKPRPVEKSHEHPDPPAMGLPDPIETSPIRHDGSFYTVVDRLISQGAPHEFEHAWIHNEASDQPLGEPQSQMLVTVIMPTFNRANLIGDAIRSVLDQTHSEWELIVCDDGSTDNTEAVVANFSDPRISWISLPRGGAAKARNAGLASAGGDLVAYLDTDNLWHPRFLEVMASALGSNTGHYGAYCRYIDIYMVDGHPRLRAFDHLPFDYDALSEKNFIDLNGFVHRRLLYTHLGGFDERLVRQQDWNLILRYTFLRDPLYVDRLLMLYRRNEKWDQITTKERHDKSSPALNRSALRASYQHGSPRSLPVAVPDVAFVCSQSEGSGSLYAHAVAETIVGRSTAKLVTFEFPGQAENASAVSINPDVRSLRFPGWRFPEWNPTLAKVAANLGSDVVVAADTRLPSLATALLANYHFGSPIVVVDLDDASTESPPNHIESLSDLDPGHPELLDPMSLLWTQIARSLKSRIPFRISPFDCREDDATCLGFLVRYPRDQLALDSTKLDRVAIRRNMGIEPNERWLLFGGPISRDSGVFELAGMVSVPGSVYRLIAFSAEPSPDVARLRREGGSRVHVVDSPGTRDLTTFLVGSDAIVIWTSPNDPTNYLDAQLLMSSALAMKVPILANDVADFGTLAQHGYLRLTRFRDVSDLEIALGEVFDNQSRTADSVARGERLFRRQFSTSSVRLALEMALTAAASSEGVLTVAEEFADFNSAFQARLSTNSTR